jgi:hypothetical protein
LSYRSLAADEQRRETETMINRILSESELAAHIEDLAGCEARRDVAERLAAEAYADGVRTIAELDARWPEDGPFFSCYAAAADEIDASASEVVPLCADCVDAIGGACAGPDCDWCHVVSGESCGAADCRRAGAPLLYWRSADGQSDLYGGEYAADIDKTAEAGAFLRELLAQCATDAERASIIAGRVEWVAS